VPPALRPRCYGIWIRKAQQLISCDAKPLSELPSKKIISGKRELPELIIPTGYEKFDVLPADFSYRNFDLHLSERKRPTERLLKMSRSLRELYEFLVLDCPPGISWLSENVLRAADAVIVPLLPTPLSVRMLMQLRDFVAASEWGDLKLLPFFSWSTDARPCTWKSSRPRDASFPKY
jgi:MinD-like ATPase involved in chromosome partitioning or flagellar assembly